MKTNGYCTTLLEDWVTQLYIKMGIVHPKQIDPIKIARYFHIFIHYKPINSFYQILGRYRGITIDTRESFEKRRELFFHELCHILRHVGTQTMIPEAFRELQEWDARNFVRYAAIPFHMLKFINFEDKHILEQMSEQFQISTELCLERLLQLERNGYFNGVNVPDNLYICD